jgi:flagellar L-ring protein FlgH
MTRSLALLPLLLLAGCAGSGGMRDAEWAPMASAAYATSTAPTDGAIYRTSSGMSLFQDTKARQPGDLLTIVLVERTQASTSASTNTSKESSAGIEAPSLFGGPLTANGRNLLNTEVSGARSFNGKGDSAQSNRLDGNLTVTVVDRLPNGNLIVRGEKRLSLNQGNEVIRLQGVVRAADINPDNTVPSSRIADARIVYGGRGPVAQSNVMGWLTRFFNSGAMPL